MHTSLPRQNQATQLMKNCNKLLQNCPLWAWGVVKVILSWLLKWRKVALNEIHAPLAINGPYFSSTTALPDSADQSETKIGMRVTNCVSLGSEFSFNPLLSKCVNDIRQLCLILQACDFVCQETSKNELSSGPGSFMPLLTEEILSVPVEAKNWL